jgi:hypothetical protein
MILSITSPVSGGDALPGDRDADVDAEQAGEDGDGQVSGELEQHGHRHPADARCWVGAFKSSMSECTAHSRAYLTDPSYDVNLALDRGQRLDDLLGEVGNIRPVTDAVNPVSQSSGYVDSAQL